MFERKIYITPIRGSKEAPVIMTTFLFRIMGSHKAVQFSAIYNLLNPNNNPALLPYQIAYHSPVPQYDGHLSDPRGCWLHEEECFFHRDTEKLCQQVALILVEAGSEFVWPELEKIYTEKFQ